MKGNLRFKIDRASLIVGRKFTVFALFYFVFEGNFPSTSPRGAYIWRGDLTEGFCVTGLGGLYLEGFIHGGAYFRNFTVLCYSTRSKNSALSVQLVRSRKHDGELSDNKTETKLREITTPTQPNLTLSSLFRAVNKYLNALTDQGRFPFVRTDLNSQPIPILIRISL